MGVAVTAWWNDITGVELAASIVALVAVALGIRGTRYAWPPYLVSSLLYAAVFVRCSLYASAALQLVFAVAAVWGWFGWGREGVGQPALLSRGRRLGVSALVIVGWFVVAPLLHAIGGAAGRPDAFLLVASLGAQVLMVKRYVDAWLLWLVADFVGVLHYAHQGLWFTALFYAVLVVMAVSGLRSWSARNVQAEGSAAS